MRLMAKAVMKIRRPFCLTSKTPSSFSCPSAYPGAAGESSLRPTPRNLEPSDLVIKAPSLVEILVHGKERRRAPGMKKDHIGR